jgi:hypothetical protein
MKTVVDWQNPEDLNRLLTMSRQELQEYYPQLSWESLRRTKNKYKSKLGKVRAMEQAGQEPTEAQKRLVRTWEVARGNADDEWDVITLHSYDHTPEVTVDDLFPQVEASKITPTKRRRIQKLGELILGYGDGQVDFRLIRDPRTAETEVVPLQNIEMHRIILRMNAHYMPKTTINGGDFGDFSGSSRFPADSNHFTDSMTMAMQWIHDFYSQMVADNPNQKFGGDATHVEVASNHADRPRKKVLRDMAEMYNFYRPGEDYPAHTYYSMARLGELGIIHPTGYPHGEYVTGEDGYPQIVWKHGSITGKNAIYREAELYPNDNLIRFHNHGEVKMKRTTREGQQLFYMILGSSCINNAPVPGFSSAVDDFNRPVKYHNPNHVNSFVFVRDYGQGRFEPVTIDVVDGIAVYDSMIWDGREPFEWEYKYGYINEDGTTKTGFKP